MKKLFCIADVHSFYDEMIEALTEAGFDIDNKDHIIIHCGDLLDRGPKALDCLNFINNIPKNRKILIRGNHEDLLEEALDRGYFCWHDHHNGTIDTCAQLSEISEEDILQHELTLFAAIDKVKNRPELNTYLNSLVDYYEVDNYVFVHGWIPTKYTDGMLIYNVDDGYWRDGDWKSSRWLNGMKEWSNNYRLADKTIVCGHWHSSWGHFNLHGEGTEFGKEANFESFIDDGIVALDGCTVYSKKVNCYVIEIEDDKWLLNM